ncbi:c-type cytochrome [Bordetella sp. 2513F-2]
MGANRGGIAVVVGLALGLPLAMLAATAYQILHTGVSIRATEVRAPAPEPPGESASAPSPASPANPPPGTTAQAGMGQIPAPQPAEPVPGRSALDFTAFKSEWEAAVREGDPQAGAKLAAAGKPDAGVQACVACHGQQGIAPGQGNFPNLAGLSSEYIAKQLDDYRNGSRNHALMTTIAKGLSPQEIGDLARHYGSLAAPAANPPAQAQESARTLDVAGENARALPACANCHGPQGRGEGVLLPRLAGQPQQYFIDQMNAFRANQRRNDDVGVMRAFAQRLTPEEIRALAAYYEQAAR